MPRNDSTFTVIGFAYWAFETVGGGGGGGGGVEDVWQTISGTEEVGEGGFDALGSGVVTGGGGTAGGAGAVVPVPVETVPVETVETVPVPVETVPLLFAG